MNILILTSKKESSLNATEKRLQDELIKRGHSVSLLDIDNLEKDFLKNSKSKPTRCCFLTKHLSQHRTQRIEHILLPALRAHLQANKYDAILPTQIFSAEIASRIVQDQEGIASQIVLVSTECDSLPQKANLFCDEYIVLSKQAIGRLIDWGISAERIHLIQVSDRTITEICTLIEQLLHQWMEEILKTIVEK